MTSHQNPPPAKPLPDFKAEAIELSRQLIDQQAQSQERRLAILNDLVWQAMQSPIKDASIGK
jgi:hypothetical protein